MIPEANVESIQAAIDADLQAAYGYLIARNEFHQASELKAQTGVTVKISEDELNRRYEWCFAKEWPDDSWVEIAFSLKKLTGVGPSDEQVQKGYQKCFKRAFVGGLKEIMDLSGIGPNVDQKAVQDG